MKKILIIVLFIFISCHNVFADNLNNIVDIKYKWYKEEQTDGFYHPKKDNLPGYLEDKYNIKYSSYTEWDINYCSYSKDNYLIEEKEITTYDKLVKAKYIRIDTDKVYDCANNVCFNDIKVFSGKNSVGYKIIRNESNIKVLELYEEIDIDDLWFYISANQKYYVYVTDDIKQFFFNLGYGLGGNSNNNIVIPFNNWILGNARYHSEESDKEISPSPFIKNIVKKKICRLREKNTYRYKIEKVYYDDNYYSHVENYLPDINDYYITYNDNYHKENIGILPKKEHIYIETDKNKMQTEQNSTLSSKDNQRVFYKTEYVDRVINKIPKKIYLILILLMAIIIVELIILVKKKVD